MRWYQRRSTWVVVLLALAGCATLQQLAALRLVEFALGKVKRGKIAGIDIGHLSSASELSALDLGRVGIGVAKKDLPLEFTVDLKANNPAENKVVATMVKLQWALYLQGKETINGVLDSAVTLSPGQVETIPMTMRLNLLQFFGGSALDVVKLALGLAGATADTTRVTLKAVPTIETPLGPLNYPQPITVVSRTVGGKG
jgi:hypothetical protein